ncbi:hypothetical protein BLA60_05275 [Actinophytocola xinjiangensis]|uniref:Uncharacterized protein n=1 Tax=Actinophytocola xinjiangensis TaxID=485602 RepID=A0A7Z1AZ39_9PSEU|nr:hypothetical protein BLA60_05275 [Actinophytocola xinjiangensis]
MAGSGAAGGSGWLGESGGWGGGGRFDWGQAGSLAEPVGDVFVRAGEEAQLVGEADGGWEAAPARFGVGLELGVEGAGRVQQVQRRQPRTPARAVHALAQPAQSLDDLLRRAHRTRLAVRAADQHVDLDVAAGGAVLGAYVRPVLAGDGQKCAPDLSDQPILLGLIHHRLRLGHDKIPTLMLILAIRPYRVEISPSVVRAEGQAQHQRMHVPRGHREPRQEARGPQRLVSSRRNQ